MITIQANLVKIYFTQDCPFFIPPVNWNAPSFRNASEINSTSIVVHFDDYPRIDWNAPSMHFVVKWKELEPVTEEEVFLLNINLIF